MSDPNVIKPRRAPLSNRNPDSPRDPLEAGSIALTEGKLSGESNEGRTPHESSLDPSNSAARSVDPRVYVAVGAALIAAALYWVFVALPANIASTTAEGVPGSAQVEGQVEGQEASISPGNNGTGSLSSSTAPTSSPIPSQSQPPGQSPPVSPFRDAQLARAKELAETELATFVELQIELEDKLQISAWGQSRYDAVKDLATEGDAQFQARQFEPALATYRAATLALEELRASGEEEFSTSIAAGNAALDDFNQLLAIRWFERAMQIKPTHSDALEGMKRAEKLPEIQAKLRKARQLARRGDTQAATQTYNEILAIDPQTASVKEALAELADAATQADYQDHLSRGFAALESGRYDSARNAFNAALGIRPEDSVALGGLQQIAQETEVLSLQNLEKAARQAVVEERWEDAVSAFEEALSKDKNLAFAQSGRRNALERKRLSRGLNIIVSQSERLSDNKRMQEAITLLEEAATLSSAGPRWNAALAKAQQTVKAYQQPVPVRLTSNNKTQVTVYKVGRLGTFSSHDLELRPGAYTIVGSADGCQDIRKEVIVKPQMGPVEIVCEKRL